MFIPTKENYTEMAPEEFEKYVLLTLENYFRENGVEKYSFEHNVKKEAYDGTYQIDGVITMSIVGIDITILVECKRYRGPVKREHIQALNDKLRSMGAHKGIFITTSYYQTGALKYAKEHGIALISVIDGNMRYETRGNGCLFGSNNNPSFKKREYTMAMQTQSSETSVSVLYLEKTDGLFRFIVDNSEDDI